MASSYLHTIILIVLHLQIPLLVFGCSDDECSVNKDKCVDVSPLCARVSALCDNIFFAQWKEMRCACPKTCGLCTTGPVIALPTEIKVVQTPAKCNPTTHPLEVVLVLDGSGSITSSDFDTQLAFAKQIARDLAVSSKGHRLGLVQYSTLARTEIALGQYNDTGELETAIDRIRQMDDGTMTGAAITWAMQNVFDFSSSSSGGVLATSKACIVVTDGRSGDSVKGPSDQLRQKGVHMFAIGVGNIASREELDEIADDHSHEYTVDNFRALNSTFAELLNKKICQDAFISSP